MLSLETRPYNLIFGVVDVELCQTLYDVFTGPQFGLQGIREISSYKGTTYDSSCCKTNGNT